MTTVSSVLSLLTPGITNSLAAAFGGTAAAVQTGIGTSTNALISGIASRSGDIGFSTRLFHLACDSGIRNVSSTLHDITSGVGTSPALDQGEQLVAMVFRNNRTEVENMIGRFSGLGPLAGNGLMSIAAPLTLAVLGQCIHYQGLTPSSFSALIKSEAEKIKELLPASLSNLLKGAFIPATDSAYPKISKHNGTLRELIPLIGMILLAIVAWPLSGGCNREVPANAPSVAAGAATSAVPSGFVARKLPDGTQLDIPPQGIESKLLDFIQDASKPVDKTTWFDFDRLTFDAGSAKLQPASNEQLQNVAMILTAYPKVNAKVGGYTDNTGNPTANLKLSADRATNVMNELITRGIASSHLTARGYGQEHPVADNSTAEGRQKNRRISLLVTAK